MPKELVAVILMVNTYEDMMRNIGWYQHPDSLLVLGVGTLACSY